jgi:molecular chaperone GrpE
MDEIDQTTNENVSIEDLQKDLSQAMEVAESNLTGWKRAQADLENFRRRAESEQGNWVELGKAMVLQKFLPFLDSLEQAIVHAPEVEDPKYTNWKSGLSGLIKQMEGTMTELGIEKMEPIGKKFDPNLHEAVKQVEGKEDDVVAEQYQTGYLLHGKVIRAAQVVITKKQD